MGQILGLIEKPIEHLCYRAIFQTALIIFIANVEGPAAPFGFVRWLVASG